VSASHTDVQSTLVVKTDRQVLDPVWSVSKLSLEDLVLAYLAPDRPSGPRPAVEVLR
jgi:ABC-2 type transport system ATP-binding protein